MCGALCKSPLQAPLFQILEPNLLCSCSSPSQDCLFRHQRMRFDFGRSGVGLTAPVTDGMGRGGSMSMMVTCGAVLVGTFHECVGKFRLAAFMALLHVLMAFSVIVATYMGYASLVYPYTKGVDYYLWNRDQVGILACPLDVHGLVAE
jgi:hypothetical protein